MRTALYGKQLAVVNNQFIGINLGYNYCSEHENGTKDLVTRLNGDKSKLIDDIQKVTTNTLKSRIMFSKKIETYDKLLSKWNNTMFKDYILYPSTPTLRRKITIDNSELRNNSKKTLLMDGKYILLIITDGYLLKSIEDKLGNKRKFPEGQFLNMSDYQSSTYYINDPYYTQKDEFAASWEKHGITLLIKEKYEYIVDDIEDALKRGCLAVVPEESRLFKSKGCCLIDLEHAYFGQHAV